LKLADPPPLHFGAASMSASRKAAKCRRTPNQGTSIHVPETGSFQANGSGHRPDATTETEIAPRFPNLPESGMARSPMSKILDQDTPRPWQVKKKVILNDIGVEGAAKRRVKANFGHGKDGVKMGFFGIIQMIRDGLFLSAILPVD
jgi:hypothetical protein